MARGPRFDTGERRVDDAPGRDIAARHRGREFACREREGIVHVLCGAHPLPAQRVVRPGIAPRNTVRGFMRSLLWLPALALPG